jgi:hypothetical protein
MTDSHSEMIGRVYDRAPRYDWANWRDGAWWLLKPGEDYPSDMAADEFSDRIYVYAHRHGIRAEVLRHSGGEKCENRVCRQVGRVHPDETGPFLLVRFTPRP